MPTARRCSTASLLQLLRLGGLINCYSSYGWVNYGPYSVVSAATVG
jgi:hypothetical protein